MSDPKPTLTSDAGAGDGKPPSGADENESAIVIGRLKAEVTELKAQLAAYVELDAERDAAEKKAKSDKKGKALKVAIAKVQVLGDGRRTVEIGKRLTDTEVEGLTEGVHFDLVDLS